MQTLETNRLILRNFVATDAPDLFEYTANPRVNCFLEHNVSTLEDALIDIEKRSIADEYIAVCLKESNKLIGGLFNMKEEPDTYSIGWNFNARYEGKGYAGESAKAFMEYLYMQQEARRLYAYVEDDNFRSQKLCEKLGMRQEGLFKEFISFTKHENGTPKYENTFQYALLKKEWTAQRANQK